MLERAEETISRAYPSVHISYKESDILEYADTRQCDLFFSSRVLEYIEDKKAFTEKVAELLAHGGKGFIITKMPHYDRDEMLGRKAARFHLGQITPEALVGLLEEAGLSVEGAYPVTLSFPQVRIPGLNLLLAKIFAGSPVSLLSSFFAESYCVVFSKE
jgi:predicted TPR repeat methyltransferase